MSGAPAGDFGAYANYALAELVRLDTGRVVISDTNYTISGEAPLTASAGSAVATPSSVACFQPVPP
jgi:OOP family OmpA-OmpF porin